MWAIFNVFIELVMILFLFLFFGHVACGILAPQPEPESTPSALKSKVLTSGLSGKSHYYILRWEYGGYETWHTQGHTARNRRSWELLFLSQQHSCFPDPREQAEDKGMLLGKSQSSEINTSPLFWVKGARESDESGPRVSLRSVSGRRSNGSASYTTHVFRPIP